MSDANGSTQIREVAVVGVGIMGSAMARNLIAAGLSTSVWDRSPSATEPPGRSGGTVAPSAKEAVRQADVVITMLPTAAILTSVMIDGGVVDALLPGSVWAQMGTIGVGGTLDLAQHLDKHRADVQFVDAPVSGSKGPAETGELLILASGPRDAAPKLRQPFAAIGRKPCGSATPARAPD